MMVQNLLAAGANPNVQSSQGFTALMGAVVGGYVMVVQSLLAAGADPNVQSSITGYTPLIHAAAEGYGVVVQHLLRAGADPNIQDSIGRTALDYATSEGHSRVVQLLEAANREGR